MNAMLLRTEKEMEAFAGRLANRILGSRFQIPAPVVIALEGDLGSGKTTFTRTFAKALGARGRVTSPTFVLARRYRISRSSVIGHQSSVKYLWHLDVYRLKGKKDLATINFHDMISEPGNVVVIEWADKVRSAIPKKALWIHFQHHPKGRIVQLRR